MKKYTLRLKKMFKITHRHPPPASIIQSKKNKKAAHSKKTAVPFEKNSLFAFRPF